MKRNHLTVARLRDVKLHAIRINGHLHVTGASIHGCLLVPTRTFWSALAILAAVDEPEFGDEYAFFRRCVDRIGSRRFDFTVTVHGDKARLLTDVRDPRHQSPGMRVDFEMPAPVSADLERQLPWDEILEAILDERTSNSSPAYEDEAVDESWPLLEGFDPQMDARRVWGWELGSLPKRESNQLLNGPDGTLRPSRN